MIIVLCNSETSETANKSNLSRKSLDWPCVKCDRLDCASLSMWRSYSPGNGEWNVQARDQVFQGLDILKQSQCCLLKNFSMYVFYLSAVNLQRASQLSKRHAQKCCFVVKMPKLPPSIRCRLHICGEIR